MNSARLSEMSKKQPKINRGQHSVVLHDDNVNTFDHVINCLIDVCGHNQFQAEQCALIVHTNKRCAVFTDSYVDCELVYEYLFKLGLKVTIEKFKK
jgi:ATP-dependent Clp protease adaptor protein ClpS